MEHFNEYTVILFYFSVLCLFVFNVVDIVLYTLLYGSNWPQINSFISLFEVKLIIK